MEKIEAIRNRHSVRHYTDEKIEIEKINELKKEIDICNHLSGLNIQLVTDEPDAFGGFMAHYGHFEGVRNYIAMIGAEDKDLEEKVGYFGERLVVKAGLLGLNSCWVALTYSKRKTHVEINDHERLVCVIAFGYGSEQGVQHKFRAIEKVAKLSNDDPEWYRRGVEIARLAPTAMNQQKYYIERNDNIVKISAGLGFYTKVDLGIVKYHFEVGAGKENFKWVNSNHFNDDLHESKDHKNVLIISSSPRKDGNSDRLCQEFMRGALDAGHTAEIVRVAEKNINFCTGCFGCSQTHKCVIEDDMEEIIKKLLKADVIVLSSPVYFYNMCAQLKVFIDRLLPCYDKIESDIYLIATGWDEDFRNLSHALEAIRGLTHDCLVHCKEKGRIVAGGVNKMGDIENRSEMTLAYQMGRNC